MSIAGRVEAVVCGGSHSHSFNAISLGDASISSVRLVELGGLSDDHTLNLLGRLFVLGNCPENGLTGSFQLRSADLSVAIAVDLVEDRDEVLVAGFADARHSGLSVESDGHGGGNEGSSGDEGLHVKVFKFI